jgi:hypothetical protein
MLSWMLYVMFVSLCLGGAALAAEHAERIRRGATRWLWMSGIVASLLLPAAISSVSIQIPRIPSLVSPAASSKVVVLRHGTMPGLSPSDWLGPGVRRIAAQASVDTLLRRAWAAASLGLACVLLLCGAHLYWRQRRWTRGTIAGVSVYLTPDVGPAVVGLIRPRIAVPRWLLDSPSATQQLVIAHERAHLTGNDVQLFTCALFLLACMPWNLPLWWQLRRLRRAIEVDCDVRVLRQGGDARAYGEVLLAVGQRQSGYLGAVAGMSESASFLEERIRLMLRQPVRWRNTLIAGLAVLSLTLLAVAAEVEPPNAAGDHREITLDASVLDRFVGYYQLAPSVFITITRDGDGLRAQLTGQGAQAIYPESPTRFFYKVVDAQIEFTEDPQGKITSLILHQHGEHRAPRVTAEVAKASAGALAARIQAQTAQPGSAAAVARLIEWITSGKPDYAAMTPELGAAMRRGLPTIQPSFNALGPVVSVKFAGVGNQGWDLYDVTHEHGKSQVRIILDAGGIITGALVTPVP